MPGRLFVYSNAFAYLCAIMFKTVVAILAMLTLLCVSANAQYYTVECEDTCRHIHGTDVSHYQGDVFWEAVGDNSKLQYVYIKATEGATIIDDRYADNIIQAHRHGLKVGSYHFFRVRAGLREQLENFMSQCRPGDQDLIPMIDVESTNGMSSQQFCDSLHTFLKMVEQVFKQKPLLYTFRNFYNKHLAGKFDDYQFMIAMYTPEPPELSDGRDFIMWQYTAKGRINGISTYVDKSRFMGRHSMREIRYRHH